jgi:SPP1 gp7 family putative phage head morphogenesis protein
MKQPKSAQDELIEFMNRNCASMRLAMRKYGESVAMNSNNSNILLDKIRLLIGETMTLSDLYGRRRVLLWQKYAQSGMRLAARVEVYAATEVAPNVPHIVFREAVEDLVQRTPELAHTAAMVSDLYLNHHAFACANSAKLFVTQKVQEHLTNALKAGLDMPKAISAIVSETEDWTRAYAETVYRTNVHSAYAAGEIRQSLEPVALQVLPAWIYEAVGDSVTRPNHLAADGMIAAKRDPVWDYWYPPAGFSCRCACREMDVYDLEEKGRLTSSGQVYAKIPVGISSGAITPDKGFGGTRPDRRIYR